MPALSIDQECPAGRVLRQAFSENIPQRHRNGRFAGTAKIQRGMLHEALRAKVGLPAVGKSDILLTDAERSALWSVYVEDVRGPEITILATRSVHTSMVGKLACAAVLAAAVIMIIGWGEPLGAVIASTPIPKLIAATLRRIV